MNSHADKRIPSSGRVARANTLDHKQICRVPRPNLLLVRAGFLILPCPHALHFEKLADVGNYTATIPQKSGADFLRPARLAFYWN